ncbi:hypothetical protein KIL84_008429 [Mauremys mutica]|uniref:Uncharacterized protein n=1 Tax=Mauremys mutica TaxID=74926 RepID=A0A9D3XA97_9SAUR|nr:hypothetical protein KIL84_008429 [Mauremys mutica]
MVLITMASEPPVTCIKADHTHACMCVRTTTSPARPAPVLSCLAHGPCTSTLCSGGTFTTPASSHMLPRLKGRGAELEHQAAQAYLVPLFEMTPLHTPKLRHTAWPLAAGWVGGSECG